MGSISTIEFAKKYKKENLKEMARTESDAKVRERLLGLHHLINGKSCKDAAGNLCKTEVWLRKWVLRYDSGGYENLFDHYRSGQPKFISEEQEQELVQEILQLQDKRNGGRLTAKDIQLFVNKKYAVNYQHKSIYDLLKRIKMSWVSSRSRHPMADEKKQKNFKQTIKARIKKNL